MPGGQNTGASASALVLPMNIQHGFSLGLTGLISLQFKGLSRVFSNTSLKASILQRSAFLMIQLSHLYMTTGKTIALTRRTFLGKVMSLLFNLLSRFCHSFSSKEQASFNFTTIVIVCSDFEAQENKVCHCFHCFPSICHEVMGPDAMISVFLNVEFQARFFTLLFHPHREALQLLFAF